MDTSLRFGGQQDYLVIALGNQHIGALRYLFALVRTLVWLEIHRIATAALCFVFRNRKTDSSKLATFRGANYVPEIHLNGLTHIASLCAHVAHVDYRAG